MTGGLMGQVSEVRDTLAPAAGWKVVPFMRWGRGGSSKVGGKVKGSVPSRIHEPGVRGGTLRPEMGFGKPGRRLRAGAGGGLGELWASGRLHAATASSAESEAAPRTRSNGTVCR